MTSRFHDFNLSGNIFLSILAFFLFSKNVFKTLYVLRRSVDGSRTRSVYFGKWTTKVRHASFALGINSLIPFVCSFFFFQIWFCQPWPPLIFLFINLHIDGERTTWEIKWAVTREARNCRRLQGVAMIIYPDLPLGKIYHPRGIAVFPVSWYPNPIKAGYF